MAHRFDPLITRFFLATAGVFLFLVCLVYIAGSPYFTRAASGTVNLALAVQGNHRDTDKLKALIAFYNGPEKVFEETSVPFEFGNNAFTATVALPSDFAYEDRYALFVKPEKYTGRIFCNEQLSGEVCRTPQFAFLTNGNTVSLTKFMFMAGDIPPSNGKVDAGDISLILRELGKTATSETMTDVNNDGITNVVDYSLTIYALAQGARDDEIHLESPAPLSPTPLPTAVPSATRAPTPTIIPTPSAVPTATPPPPAPTAAPTPTSMPTPTSIPRLGKNCSNGTMKVSQPLNSDWGLNVLAIPYGYPQYRCVPAQTIVLHWSDSPNFLGNSATWGALNTKNVVCGLAIDDKETLQMSNFYDDKITWEGCSNVDNSINIEINGTQFDLWYDKNCQIVNPASNKALAAGELQKAKETIAAQYHVSPTVMDWENERYVAIMEKQEKRVLDAVRYLLLYYNIPKEEVTGHYKLTSSKPDPGPRFLECIRKKL